MTFLAQGPLDTGGKFEEFSDGQGGTIRLEYRVDLQTPALEVWGGRPEAGADDTEQHTTLAQLAILTP